MMEIEVVLFSNILAAILAITAYCAVRRGGRRPARISGILTLMVIILMVMICLELFNFWSNGKTLSWVPLVKYITTPLHNFFTVFFPGIACIFVYEYSFINGKSKKVWFYLVFPAIIWAMVLVLNYWIGFVFTIDENMVYHRGSLVYFTFIMPFVYCLLGFIIPRTGFVGNKNLIKFPVWIFALPALGFMVFQALVPGVSTIHLGLALGFCGMCIAIQKEGLYIDPLTRLYNRTYLFYMFSQARKNKKRLQIGAIMLDINDFKHINDEFGHRQGDIALTEAASIIANSLVSGGTATRFAGDEFVVFIMLNDIKDSMKKTIEKIRLNTEAFNNRKERDYKINFAIGSSLLREDEDLDELLERVDENMYQDKLNKAPLRRRV